MDKSQNSYGQAQACHRTTVVQGVSRFSWHRTAGSVGELWRTAQRLLFASTARKTPKASDAFIRSHSLRQTRSDTIPEKDSSGFRTISKVAGNSSPRRGRLTRLSGRFSKGSDRSRKMEPTCNRTAPKSFEESWQTYSVRSSPKGKQLANRFLIRCVSTKTRAQNS